MARTHTHEIASSYYPPRARWYSRLWHPWFAFQRALRLEKIHLPRGITFLQTILGIALPGFAFFANGRRLLGWAFAAVYLNALIFFIVGLGYPIANIGFGLMIAAHASSIIFLEGYWLRDACRFQFRLAIAVLTLLVVWLCGYAPLIGFAEQHWIIPLRVRGNVVIVQRAVPPRNVGRGDRVMYSFNTTHNALIHNQAVYVEGGFGWGPVLALAGDRVEFSTNSFFVNGVARKLFPHMPQNGEFVVPEKHWFIWPEFDMVAHGNVGEANISEMLMELSVIPENQFVGKPFKHWCGRRQIIEATFTN